MIARLGGAALVGFTRTLVGARAQWRVAPPGGQCIYFANHTSHLDTVAIWSALTPQQRARVRPVAARDYWDKPGLRGWLSGAVLRAILIDRNRETTDADPLAPVREALDQGDSLILFPEGTRSNERLPQAFKGGLFRLATECPHVELVPVYLDTLHRSLPKGALLPLPLPLYCNVNFGAPLARIGDEPRETFLERARAAVEAMA
ncbi:lysophospholipid acyltransferase family protein [Luteimonas kalidii]|uniref:Lysophospholipid acyltransferase family protein n=1 Tax=Luteimonas kalidii TaxID=3042025 RepID=A0ABT6JVC0_9GAMM|nr:lysophospholipid acyltransferase family protein [Luteimonas kalidii]MDH5834633.1 lysophospholipid acyltransferase family protein [Luteimonas kalidii]